MSEHEPLLSSPNDVEASTGDRRSLGRIRRWKEQTARFLESPSMHYTVLSLVIIDSACVLADLAYTVLSESCTPIEGPDAPTWLNVLSHISMVITIIFLTEIPVTLWALGVNFYNPFSGTLHASLHLFDAFIIVTTFVLEVALKGRERELVSLLIILRLWRLVKLVGGIAVGAGDLEEENAKALMETRQELEETTRALTLARDENQELRARIAWLESEGSASSS
ncbi:hypothetical protein K474DRAFT_1681140 [Panus rudis PR-1116 ss-1]|nr:hypothetical protein K474DRAFT_1681140 [Panus rudis PR-1116 ss-1]